MMVKQATMCEKQVNERAIKVIKNEKEDPCQILNNISPTPDQLGKIKALDI